MKASHSTLYLRSLGHLNTLSFSSLQILLFTLIPFLAEKMNLSLASVVSTFSVGSLLFLWSSPFWSSRSDRWGRQVVLIIGILGLTFSTALIVGLMFWDLNSTPKAVILLMSRLIYGVFASAIVPVSQALQADLAQEKSAMRAMMGNSMSLNIGRALGPAYILLSGGEDMIRVLQGSLAWLILVLIINLAFWAVLRHRSTVSVSGQEISWLQSVGHLRGIFTLAILFTSFIGILNSSLAAILQKAFSLESTASSYLMAQLLLVSIAIALVTQSVSRWYFKNPWQGSLLIGNAALLVGTLTLRLMNSEIELWMAIALLSVGIALIPPSYLSLMASLQADNMGLGKRAGLVGAANTLGYTLGGILTALVLKSQVMGLESLMICMALMIFANITLLYKNRPVESSL